MKKWLLAGMGLVLAACVMTGCSKSEEPVVDSIAGMEQGYGAEQSLQSTNLQNDTQASNILTIGTIFRGDDSELARVVRAYNEQGGPYTVEVLNYAEDTEEYEAVKDRFLMELMSGKGTDIIDLVALDKNSLGAAGVLENLYELMPEEQKNAYVPNILNCVETEGKLYGVGPRFSVYTVVANQEKVGEEVGWTMGEMIDVFAGYGKGAEAWEGFYADESTVTTLGKFTLDDYIDWNEGKAVFCCEEFYRMLEFDKERRSVNETAAVRPEFTDLSRAERIEQGYTLASLEILTSVSHFQMVNEIYGRQAMIKGFPASEGTGIAIEMYSAIGINANCGKEEAAWDFVKFYLEEYENVGFAIHEEQFEKELEESMTQEYTEDGEMLYKNWSDNFGVYAATEEDVAAVRNAIALADRECIYNEAVLQIINEEADVFCKDGITVEKAAENINNRVQLYLDEICRN